MAVALAPSRALDLYLATESVIGQKPARKKMAAILDGQWRVAQGIDLKQPGGVLLAGRSGTGKTMTARIMCRHLGLPYAETDATRYAEVAYKGLQLPQMFIPLLRDAARLKDGPESTSKHTDSIFKRDDLDEIVAAAQTGVIVLDEFDKWMHRVNHVTGQRDTAIQGELLKLIEGSQEFVTATDDEVGVPFDTSRVLIICAGAFVGLYQQVRARLHEDSDPKAQQMDDQFWNSIVPEDFERFGLLPELAGRLSRHIFTRPLNGQHLRRILEHGSGLLAHYRARYESYGVRWAVSEAGVVHLVAEAAKLQTGARALEHVVDKMLGGELLYEAAVSEADLQVRLEPNMPKAVLEPVQ